MRIANLPNSQRKAVNAMLAKAFFPRTKTWLYPRIAGSFTSTSAVEPFSIMGTVPPLRRFNGFLGSRAVLDYGFDSPNLLFKNHVQIDQEAYEFDQTGTLVKHSAALGIRLSEHPDMLLCSRIIKGSNTADKTVKFKGQTYNLTFDGMPFFSEAHDTELGGEQSNIISGSLPQNPPALFAADIETSAKQMQRDFAQVLRRIKTLKDPQGVPLFPTLTPKDNLTIVVPPCLETIAMLAFRPGHASSVITQTTNIFPQLVKDVVCHGYLEQIIDPETGDLILPPNATDWYVAIDNDYVRPLYMQMFRPLRDGERNPPDGISNDNIVEDVLAAVDGITADAATLWASTRIDTTFNKVGANADRATIETDSFSMSARWKGNCVYGPWFTMFRVIPSGGNIFFNQGTDESSSSSSSSSNSSLSSSSSNSSSSSSKSSSSSSSG